MSYISGAYSVKIVWLFLLARLDVYRLFLMTADKKRYDNLIKCHVRVFALHPSSATENISLSVLM